MENKRRETRGRTKKWCEDERHGFLELRSFAYCLVSWRVDDARTRAWRIKHVGMAKITICEDKHKTVENCNGKRRVGENVGKGGGASWFKVLDVLAEMLDLVC